MVRGDRYKFLLFIILSLIIFSLPVFAENETTTEFVNTVNPVPVSRGYDQAVSYKWLYNNVRNLSSNNVDERTISTIALIQSPPVDILQMRGFVESLRDSEDKTNGCWPVGNCNVKDTALATLALSLSGQNVAKEVAWLQKARIPGVSGGEWQVVLKASSSNNGTCLISSKGANKSYDLLDDKIKQTKGGYTAGQYYIGLNELSASLKSSVQPQLDISCDPSLNPIVTLIYKPNPNTFFIQRSDSGANLQIKVANACFGTQATVATCNYESTAYATWVLLEIGAITQDSSLTLDNIGTHIYLESQAINKNKDPIALGLLNRILIKSGSAAPSFISDLAKLQSPKDGSWNNEIIATSIGSFGLTNSNKADAVLKANTYLVEKVGKDGSWANGNIVATSWALIALHGGELSRLVISSGGGDIQQDQSEICGNAVDDDKDGAMDCGEVECLSHESCKCSNNIQDDDEEGIDCGTSCSKDCVVDEQQPIDTTPEEPEEVPVEEEPVATEEGGSSWWVFIIILLFLLVGFGLFYFKYVKTGKINLANLFKKKTKGMSFEDFRRQAEFKPIQPQRPANVNVSRGPPPMRPSTGNFKVRSKDEEDLDKSMREAEKLLKG